MMLEICTVIFSDKRTVLSKCVLGVLYLSPFCKKDLILNKSSLVLLCTLDSSNSNIVCNNVVEGCIRQFVFNNSIHHISVIK